MCGICASVALLIPNNEQMPSHFVDKKYKHLAKFLRRRGPDSFNETTFGFKESFSLYFCSSVLHLRGSDIIVQPSVDEKNNLFLWNGEIFGGSLIEDGTSTIYDVSDTTVLARRMFSSQTDLEILEILSSVKGPYAFIYYQADGLVWFGRDIFGRRSLLWNFKDSLFQISSLAADTHGEKWEEVPTNGIFCLDLNLSIREQKFVIHQYSWSSSASGGFLKTDAEFSTPGSMVEIKPVPNLSVQIPLHLSLNKITPSGSSFSDVLCSMVHLQSCKLNKSEMFKKLLEIPALMRTLNSFETVLAEAVKKRVESQLNVCKTCYTIQKDSILCCNHSCIGILFSGGLDSIVIACLADKYINSGNSVDLLNVAFASKKNMEIETHFNTPDRITGKIGAQALKNISPCRKWNFVEVNVMDTELNIKRGQHISELLYPSCTVLDDSIGCALWFAAKGEGFVFNSDELVSYTSPARVLLVGMGADEQLAGYSRHRAKFKNAGWSGLIEEISLELDRIGSRNLGRDDRIIADNGVESRYPFLDEDVVSFLNSLPICLKANLDFERGIGEKLLLRLLAFKLGLTEAAVLPKRAIQFGSRIAKLENSKEKGSDVCTRLLTS